MSPCGSTLEEQLSSIMEVLAKAAVSEISQLFSEGSAALRFQISRSLKENEALRTRMKVMRSELCSLRLTLQTKSSASRAASRSALARVNMSKPRTKPLGHGLKPMMVHKAVGDAPSLPPFKSEASSVAEETPDIILIKEEEENMSGCGPAVEACAKFGDPSMQQGITSESLHVDAPGSSHMSRHNEQLRILRVYGKGEGPLAVDRHDTLFTASELEALSSLTPDHSVTHDSLLSLDSGTRDRVPARGMQDGTGGPGRGGRQPGHLGAHFPLQPNLQFLHGVAKNLDCRLMGKRVIGRKSLIVHRAGHTGEPPVPCALCGKSYATKNTLRVHMRVHTGEKPYVCAQCGNRFTRSGSLKVHMRTHTGERPYVCLQCTATFRYDINLRRHMVSKHMVNGVP